MLFNSYEFIFAFLPVTLIIFIFIARINSETAIAWLVFASLFFYGWWNPVYLILIISSMGVNYSTGYLINRFRDNRKKAKFLLIVGILFNLSLLGYYKYANFFLENIGYILESEFRVRQILLPLAISFFTFQQLAFLIDAYKGITKEYKFLHYALFVTFFPQLIAGPIVHHKEILPQFMDRKNLAFKMNNITVGLIIFSIGLFKKAVLADGIAAYANPVFSASDAGQHLDFFLSWGGVLSYTLQLYFDFSGYSDMAIGGARLFGIKLPLNFHSPYKALNIIEFWRHWNMTLSRFLRDYIYIALGGNKSGKIRRYLNLFTTMLLGGLWHGAGWTFIIWGALHGFYLMVNHIWRYIAEKTNLLFLEHSTIWRGFCWLLTFLAVVIGWVFFRATSFDSALLLLQSMSGTSGFSIPNGIAVQLGPIRDTLNAIGITFTLGGGKDFVVTYIWIIFLLFIALVWPNTQQIMDKFEPDFNKMTDNPITTFFSNNFLMRRVKFKLSFGWAFAMSICVTLGILSLSQVSEFLYFRF